MIILFLHQIYTLENLSSLFQKYWIFGLGFVAQMLFGIRLIVQWWITERKKKSISPTVFWVLSLGGSVLFLIYGLLRNDVVIIIGQLFAYTIYIRNLQLKGVCKSLSFIKKTLIIATPFMASFIVLIFNRKFGEVYNFNLNEFVFLGILGQLTLNFRFLYQLYYSEKIGESVLPLGFWIISLLGAVMIIIYSYHENEPVLLLSQGFALFPYLRNIFLSRNSKF